MQTPDGSRRLGALRFGTLLLLLAGCFIFGGASRLDVKSLIILQPLSVICLAIFLSDIHAVRWQLIRVPLILLTVLAGIMLVQLVPLPPEIWTSLPGHAPFEATAIAAGMTQPWRPISLTPDLTMGGLVGLSVPVAVLIGFASLPADRTRRLLPAMIVGGTLSALLGLAQISGGPQSPLYFYEVTNRGTPAGLFSNRNHQALLVAMIWPMLAVWVTFPTEPRFRNVKKWIAGAIGIFLLPMMLATGSRAGLALGALGLGVSVLFLRAHLAAASSRTGWSKVLPWAGLVAGLIVVGAAIFLSRDAAMQRAADMNLSDESRLQSLPTLLRMLADFFPVGSGFGSFDPVYRYYEPAALLSPSYLNHAHNDLLELVLVGGLPAAVVLLLFLLWIGKLGFAAWRRPDTRGSVRLARLATVIIVMVLFSSLVDYPLRTPLVAAICAVACGWLADLEQSRGSAAGAVDEDDLAPRGKVRHGFA